ncbi:hypothetical protein FHL15_010051 [Xylaria flabelliformis]|uniref:Helicase C-terminal domain-containing protein n=1 Tax=Xylaria flabelliformis TaxID=2512241 RepID=A0A553HM51_9PEZI|nr:hypothetical protein FHL15_010051 [Xylaria flabelliformis]
MSSCTYVSPVKGDAKVNLDHLIISVKCRTGEKTDHALNEFLSKKGRKSKVRAPEDYDYGMFRDTLGERRKIDNRAALYPSLLELVHVTNEASFYRCLTQIQKGEVPISRSPIYGLPFVEFWTIPEPDNGSKPKGTAHVKDAVPKVEDDKRPTQPKPSGKPPNVKEDDKNKNIIDLTQPDDEQDKVIIDLTQESDDDQPQGQGLGLDDDEELYDEGPSLLDRLAPRENPVADEDWKRVCEFFRCPVDAENIPVPGLLLPLLPYQAFAIWRAFIQVAEKKIPSFIIGDAPGLGKTGMSLAMAVIFAMLHARYQEVRDERQRNSQPRSHLGVSQSGQCPSQRTRRPGIICPCVTSGLSYQLVNCIEDFPSLFCVPPILISQWCNEAEKWIDRSLDSPARGINVFINQTLPGKARMSSNNIERIRGILRVEGQGRSRSYRLEAQRGSSSNIIIVSRHATNQLLDRFKVPKDAQRRRTSRAAQETMNSLGCGFIFFDEYHGYKGSRTRTTQPFEMLNTIRSLVRRVMAIGLSASVTKGPDMWRPFVQHHFSSREVGQLQGLNNPEGLEKYQIHYAYLVNNLGRQQVDNQAREERNVRQGELLDFANVFMPQFMLARTRTSNFRGQRIGSRYAPMRMKRLDMLPGETQANFRTLAGRVQSYLNQQFEDAVRKWEQDGRQGQRPDRRSLVNDRVQQISNNPNRNDEFSVISRASCFPYIATLYARSLIERRSLLVDNIQDIAKGISQQLNPDQLSIEAVGRSIAAVNDLLSQSPFSTYRGELRDWSPKILWIELYIRNLLRILRTRPDSQNVLDKYGPAPPDGTNARHALILSQAPIAAFLTFMILWHTFQEDIAQGNIVFIYGHSGIEPRQRSRYTAFLQQSCQNDNRVKVLISTTDIFGEGHNLQRVNSVILTEVPGSYETQKQAFGRADRQGQMMTPILYQLYDDLNLAERVKMARNRNRRRILQGADEVAEQLDIEEFFNDNSII